jgi:hypothetical protein
VQLLAAYSGHHGGITTGQKRIEGARCAMALLGTVTTEELAVVLNAGHARSGLLPRFLLAPFSSSKPPLAVPPKRGPDYARLEGRCIDWLGKLDRWNGDLGNAYDLLDAAALATYTRWYEETRAGLAHRGDDVDAALFARGATKVIKLAVVLAVSEVDDPSRMSSKNVPIRKHHIESAIALERESSRMHTLLLERQQRAQSDRYCDEIYQWIHDRGGEVPLSDALRKGYRREQGDKVYSDLEKAKALKLDPRFKIETGESGKGQRVRAL